jgi:hypothetical protein
MPTLEKVKDPAQVESGRLGARRMWGPPRIIRLDDLAPEQRSFIVELVEVAKRNAAPKGGAE